MGGFDTRTGSCVAIVSQGGEKIGICHPVKKTGYKAPNAYGAKKPFDGSTTKGHFDSKVRKVGEDTSKKLMPYSPNAPRNRPKETLTNTRGPRFRPDRNNSQIILMDGHPDSLVPPKTTNMVFQASIAKYSDNVGLANPGISAVIAREAHKQQRR
mmetsp:Transcript_31774/g.101240  ORF Transcript_31774/g.101240 Transcript_31774/m.101240 type:complete len:155 (+) Transcript_31774:141-605(+)|eukprot:CAMPEP_0182912214 /NCGR_PEP_ID=MMETSP0034_2-20130328/37395_1 /TAXON_ID=156128 /ORGANISM="Nephroselmis pyriformis, Strain CCMP717" /LENGTH=154 /DNA_ID=CAMNT_0025048871 /DNA_START=126 /DNA_END=590 /DNA_ORIENTATION=-